MTASSDTVVIYQSIVPSRYSSQVSRSSRSCQSAPDVAFAKRKAGSKQMMLLKLRRLMSQQVTLKSNTSQKARSLQRDTRWRIMLFEITDATSHQSIAILMRSRPFFTVTMWLDRGIRRCDTPTAMGGLHLAHLRNIRTMNNQALVRAILS